MARLDLPYAKVTTGPGRLGVGGTWELPINVHLKRSWRIRVKLAVWVMRVGVWLAPEPAA